MSLSNSVLDTRFRSALGRMADSGRLQTYTAPVDPYLEVAGIMKKLDGGPALLFSKVNGHDMPVIGNLLSCQANVEAAFGVDFRGVREFVGRALGDPKPPVLVERAPAQEQVHTKDIDLGKMLPALHHTADDAGRYITAGIVIARDPDTGVYNASYHRLMLAGPNRAAIQLDFGRHLRAAFERAQKKGQHLPVVVCIGSDLALHYTAATMGSQMPENADELAVAGGLCGRPLPVVKAITQDLLVPAESEIVLEGVLKCDEEVDGGPVRRVRRLSGAGRSRAGARSHRGHAPHQADLSRHQRLRPRDRGAAQVRAGGEPAQGAASRGADRHRRRDDGGRPAPLPRRRAGEEDRARPTTACSATPSWRRSAR